MLKKMLLKQSLVLITCLLFYGSFAQIREFDDSIDSVQYSKINKCISKSRKASSISVDSLINSSTISLDKHLARLYFYKASLLDTLYRLDNLNAIKEDGFNSKIKEVMKYFDLAIQKSDCISLTEYEYCKYIFMANLVSTFKKDLPMEFLEEYFALKAHLISKGLHPEKFGQGITIDYHIGLKQWIGLGVSLFSGYYPIVNFTSHCNGNIWKYKPNQVITALTAISFKYSHCLQANYSDFSFSLVDLYSPIKLSTTTFGAIVDHTTKQSNYYYRPGIGIAFGPVSISYSQTIYFVKNIHSPMEKGFISIEINYPINNDVNEPRWR